MLSNFPRPAFLRDGYKIILLGVVVLFILGLLPTTTLWIFFKILFFLAFSVYLYNHYLAGAFRNGVSEEEEDFPELDEGEQEWLQIENDQDVEEAFGRFIENTLQLIKDVLVSDTVILLLANYSKKIFTIRHLVSSQPDLLISQKSFDYLKGLPSLVLRNRTPLIENHLPESSEILPYYRSENSTSNSFIGVPVHFNDLIIGVLCADTAAEEAYSNDDLSMMKNFSRLITTQLINSNKLYEYESENWVVNTLFEFSQGLNQIENIQKIWEYLSNKIPQFIPCDRISISLKLDEKQGEIRYLDGGTGNLKPGRKFPLNEGIVGWVIRKNQSLLVEDFSTKENYVPRFLAEETPAKEYLALLAIPISSNKNTIGAICLESYQPNSYKDQYRRIIQTIANQAGTVFITSQSLEKLQQFNYKDLDTQLENINAFNFILPREIKRARKLNLSMNVLFFKLYFQIKEDDPNLFKDTVNEFISLVLPSLEETDYIFRLNTDTFAIASVESDGIGLGQLSKKLLEKVKEKKVWANGQAYGFYISLGLIEDQHLSPDSKDLLTKGEVAIKQARLEGPNNLAFYQKGAEKSVNYQTGLNFSNNENV